MPEQIARSKERSSIEAVLIKKDGTRIPMGEISNSDPTPEEIARGIGKMTVKPVEQKQEEQKKDSDNPKEK